jgi:hypothetical protein
VLATVVRGGCSRKAVTTVTRTSEAPGDSSGRLLCNLPCVGFGRRSFGVIFSPRVSGLAVLEKQKRLFVMVTGDEIVVTSDAGFRAAYCRSSWVASFSG